MNETPLDDRLVPVDPSADRSLENARRLQILRERLTTKRTDTRQWPETNDTADDK